MLMPNNPDHVFVCNKSPNAYIMTIQGQIIKTYSSGKLSGGDFVCATVSPQGKWIYCVGEDSILYVFDVLGGQLEHILQLADREIIGICHHPHRNLMCSITDIGELKLWKA
jgi:WD40 repeat-containing protein SMU1